MANQNTSIIDDPARVRSVFHPSDFSEASEVAFAHAVKIALLRQAHLEIMHVTSNATAEWSDLAGVRPMLERWGLLPPGSRRTDVEALGIHVKNVTAIDRDPVRAVLSYLGTHPTDLIVLATREVEGRMMWQHHSVARPIVQGAGEMTLFLPQGQSRFVSVQDGSIRLSNMLVPIAHDPSPHHRRSASRRWHRHASPRRRIERSTGGGSPGG